ncbi:MAG: CoA-binding protein [Vampirovibrionales bacterium]|nr:CoA-binding protein [Vampirovibrionales bacterium]
MMSFPTLRCWAVIGVSADREKYGNKVYRELREAGYRVYGVNPKLDDIEGDRCFHKLADLPEIPDVVNVVVPPSVAEGIVDDCIERGIARMWFQPGSESPAALEKARAAGVIVVSDACIMLQKQRWD